MGNAPASGWGQEWVSDAYLHALALCAHVECQAVPDGGQVHASYVVARGQLRASFVVKLLVVVEPGRR